MKCFTVSDSFRLACWLIRVNALSTNFIVYSLLLLFFILTSTFRIRGGIREIWAGVLAVTRLLFRETMTY